MTGTDYAIVILGTITVTTTALAQYYYYKYKQLEKVDHEKLNGVVDKIISELATNIGKHHPGVVPIEAFRQNDKGFLKLATTKFQICFTGNIPLTNIAEIENIPQNTSLMYPRFRILWNVNESEKKGLATTFELINDETEIRVLSTDVVNVVDQP